MDHLVLVKVAQALRGGGGGSTLTLAADTTTSYPENLSADIGNPVLLQGTDLGGLDQVSHRAGATKLHNQLWEGGKQVMGHSGSEGAEQLTQSWSSLPGSPLRTNAP